MSARRRPIPRSRRLARIAAAAALTLLPLAAGCGKRPAPEPQEQSALFRSIAEAQARADAIFSARDTMRLVRGKFPGPGYPSTFTSRSAGSIVRFLEEEEDRGDYGSSRNQYYFDPSGVLFYYVDRGEEREPRANLPPISRLVQRSAVYDSTGDLRWGRRLVDGVALALPDSEGIAIRERCVALLARSMAMTP